MAGILGVTSTSESERKQLVSHDNVALTRAGRTLTHAAAGTIARGTVLARLTADGKYVPCEPVPEDPVTGAEIALAILAEDSTVAEAGDATVTIHYFGSYNAADLVWPGANWTAAYKNLALNQLSDKGIIVDCDDFA